jgi:MoaA/NifB/PqqE/SkfB family radical SAM enzyme
MSLIEKDTVQSLTVEATSYCNLHCPQCNRFTEDGFLSEKLDLAHLQFETFCQAIKPGTFPNLKSITFEGDHGDVIMHPDAKKMFEYSSTIASVTAFTNGSIRNSQWWADLAKIKNLTVVFSIDGLKDTNYLYRINSDWDKIIENAQAFINNGGQAEWKFIIFKHNQHQIETAKKLSQDMGFTKFYAEPSSRNFFGTKIWPVKVEGNFLYNLEMADSAPNYSLRTHVLTEKIYKNQEFVSPTCQVTTYKDLYLNFKGHLLPCCMTSMTTWMDDISSRLWVKLLGNIDDIDISKRTIDQILDSDFYRFKLENSFKDKKRVHHVCVANCANKQSQL